MVVEVVVVVVGVVVATAAAMTTMRNDADDVGCDADDEDDCGVNDNCKLLDLGE